MVIDFSKETKNFSIIKGGLKVSYSALTKFRAWALTEDIAKIQMPEFPSTLSSFEVDTSSDTITVGGTPFSGSAADLVDLLRDEVFIGDL